MRYYKIYALSSFNTVPTTNMSDKFKIQSVYLYDKSIHLNVIFLTIIYKQDWFNGVRLKINSVTQTHSKILICLK